MISNALQAIQQQAVCYQTQIKKDRMVFIICFQKPLQEKLKTDCENPLIL